MASYDRTPRRAGARANRGIRHGRRHPSHQAFAARTGAAHARARREFPSARTSAHRRCRSKLRVSEVLIWRGDFRSERIIMPAAPTRHGVGDRQRLRHAPGRRALQPGQPGWGQAGPSRGCRHRAPRPASAAARARERARQVAYRSMRGMVCSDYCGSRAGPRTCAKQRGLKANATTPPASQHLHVRGRRASEQVPREFAPVSWHTQEQNPRAVSISTVRRPRQRLAEQPACLNSMGHQPMARAQPPTAPSTR